MVNKKLEFEEEYRFEFMGKEMEDENKVNRVTKEALEKSLDIRKFEIDLYWKRATYFWGFLVVIFAGYFAVLGAKFEVLTQREKLVALLLISCLGTVFSFCWFLVNKGSKYWQNNWERHVDMLEDKVMGPLYKTVLEETEEEDWKKFITKAEEFSVSKVNQILSFFLVLVWGIISIGNALKIVNIYLVNDLGIIISSNQKLINFPFFELLIVIITISCLIFLLKEGKSSHKTENKKSYHFSIRKKVLEKRDKNEKTLF